MDNLPPEKIEEIKAACAKAGYEFVGVEGGKVIIKEKNEPPALASVFTPFCIMDSEIVREAPTPAWETVRENRRVRHGKRPKFH